MTTKLLLSVRETATALGISTRSVHRYAQYGLLPHVRIGKRKLFRVRDLMRFAENGVSVERLRRVKENLRVEE